MVWTDVEYAPYVEYGHFSVAGNWVSEQPFMRPAARYTWDKFKPQMKDLKVEVLKG